MQNKPQIYSRLLAPATEDSPIVQTMYQWDQNTQVRVLDILADFPQLQEVYRDILSRVVLTQLSAKPQVMYITHLRTHQSTPWLEQ